MTLPPRTGLAPFSAALRAQLHDLIGVWRANRAHWFARSEAFDATLREQFLDAHEAVRTGLSAHTGGPQDATEGLACVLLLDQFPRNAFRGTPRMFATDALALALAGDAIARQWDDQIAEHLPELRSFYYLPAMHAESVAAQDTCVALHRQHGLEPRHAEEHRDIIVRFGRFPHRNPVLGRSTTPEEQAFLDAGGFAG